MSKIHHFFKNITKNFTLTTPVAILLGAVIISFGLMGYGLITSNNSSQGLVNNPLPKILKNAGLKEKAFTACVNSGEMASAVSNSTQDGVKAGVNGTPSTFILREENGVQYVVANISGAQSQNVFKQAIDNALSLTSVTKLSPFKGNPITVNDLQEVSTPSKVYVVEYSDAECPFCIGLHNTMKEIRTDYTGKISFVYRNFPLTSIHQHAQKEAEMIACAGKLGGAKALYGYIDGTFDYKVKNNIGFMTLNN